MLAGPQWGKSWRSVCSMRSAHELPHGRIHTLNLNSQRYRERMGTKRARTIDPRASSNTQPCRSHTIGCTVQVPGLSLTDHLFTLPLDYSCKADGEQQVFVREVVAHGRAKQQLPFLLFLQGGPGFEAPRPTEASAWLKAAVGHFRVLLMDQRGTGRSGAITGASLARLGDAAAQAAHLAHFRADAIVRDAEAIRAVLVPPDAPGGGRWTLLGQSFGGFCAVSYLSTAQQGLSEVLLTGGLPPGITQACSAEAAYRSLYRRVLAQNRKFYERFPGDAEGVRALVRHLALQPSGGVRTPCGNLLTPRALQTLGMMGLGSSGGFERLHYLLERAWDGPELSYAFLKGFDAWLPWDTNPLYALLHEAIYCQGGASAWAAQRVRDGHFSADFDAALAVANGTLVMFTGEMVFPWMFDDFAALVPLKGAADALAAKRDWPALYDAAALRECAVPVASATYFEDMYVDMGCAQVSGPAAAERGQQAWKLFECALPGQETAAHIAGMRQWITNEYMHSGIRDDGARIFEHLLALARGSVPLY